MSVSTGLNFISVPPDDFLKKLTEDDAKKEKYFYNSMEFEPLYGCCRLAVIGLFGLADHLESKKDSSFKLRKYRLYVSDNKIYIENNQDFLREYAETIIPFHQDPQWIQIIKRHVKRCLHWYPPEVNQSKDSADKEYSRRTIYKYAMIGLEVIKLSLKSEHADSAACVTRIKKQILKALDGKKINSKKFPNIQTLIEKTKKHNETQKEGDKLSDEEERELKLYMNCISTWSPANEQTVKNTINESQVATLRTTLNEILDKYLKTKGDKLST